MTRFSCDSTRAASSALTATMVSAPTRSPYSENDFENEFDTNSGPPACGKPAHDLAVFVDAVAEALVGHVEERNQAALRDDLDHLVPLRVGQVGAGRVVAAGVQHARSSRPAWFSARPACRRNSRRGWPDRSTGSC